MKNKGFKLIELLIVIAILGILAITAFSILTKKEVQKMNDKVIEQVEKNKQEGRLRL